MSTFYELPESGARVVLLTTFIVREDDQSLYGFLTAGERNAFAQLIRISGVGARTALSVLSGMSVDDLAGAIAAQDAARLVKVPGIGRKTAERLLLELKGKLAPALAVPAGQANTGGAADDVLRALLSLGYNEREASAAVRKVPADLSVTDGIRQALKLLGKA